jgi:predicted urease superfamily metal-dependent hydrolase
MFLEQVHDMAVSYRLEGQVVCVGQVGDSHIAIGRL